MVCRKQKHLERITQIIGYTNNISVCRSVYIGNYFNDKKIQPCGKCDVCTNKQPSENEDVISLKNKIEIALSKPISFAALMEQFNATQEQEVKNMIGYLIEKEIVVADQWGLLMIKKGTKMKI
jgi:ATP-dependent DNA helicase RecQ